MLVETLTALAAAGGGAVVQAAGTDAWNGLRHRVAEIFGRSDAERAQAELERLDHTARVLAPGTSADVATQRLRQEGVWAARFETLLENLDDPGRERVAEELRELLAFVAASAGDTAVATGKAVARDGGRAVTGVKNAGGGRSGPARAVNTGDAEATGTGSSAVSGIVND
jgi:head-tail adaptor